MGLDGMGWGQVESNGVGGQGVGSGEETVGWGRVARGVVGWKGKSGMGRDGMAWSGMGQDSMSWARLRLDGVGLNEVRGDRGGGLGGVRRM